MGQRDYEQTMARLRHRWGNKFVEPRTTQEQRDYFGENIRVEVVSPSGYRRRGTISCTGGWQPSLMLLHRRNASGSSDLLSDADFIVAVIGLGGERRPTNYDKFQLAVCTGELT